MYSISDLEWMRLALLEKQRTKKVFITVREAGEILGNPTSSSAAMHKLLALIESGMVEKIDDHYHVIED